jgi:hypothetical protein
MKRQGYTTKFAPFTSSKRPAKGLETKLVMAYTRKNKLAASTK